MTELAEKLHLTDNAVRAHLVTLERDGLVHQSGERPGLRKPHLSYELTSDAEDIFPKAYAPILEELLTVLKGSIGEKKVESALRQVGRNVAQSHGSEDKSSFKERLDLALKTIEGIGGQAHVEQTDGKTSICGVGCPLAVVTVHHAEVCGMLEELLTEIIGVPVRQNCRREPSPQCRFDLSSK